MGLLNWLFEFSKEKDMKKTSGEIPSPTNTNTSNVYPQLKPQKYVVFDDPGLHIAHINDSLRLIISTNNPKTFFYRFGYCLKEAGYVRDADVKLCNGKNPEQIYREFSDDKKVIEYQIQFIDNLFLHGMEDRIVFQMAEISGAIHDETLRHYIKKLNGKKYHFCKVKFGDGSRRQYTFVAKEKSISPGDTVEVDIGSEEFPDRKIVQVYEVFDASLDNLEFDIRRLKCIESRLKMIKCPNCGASISAGIIQQGGVCEYCRTKFVLERAFPVEEEDIVFNNIPVTEVSSKSHISETDIIDLFEADADSGVIEDMLDRYDGELSPQTVYDLFMEGDCSLCNLLEKCGENVDFSHDEIIDMLENIDSDDCFAIEELLDKYNPESISQDEVIEILEIIPEDVYESVEKFIKCLSLEEQREIREDFYC